jgi:assimilatory nitrate reductase catalytic subunit
MTAPASTAICTTCPYCGVGCGVLATPDANLTSGRSAQIKGDPNHPANFGRLCSKGSALGETVGLEGRLLTPRIHGEEASWDTALDLVAQKFSDAIRDHGPDSVAFYVSGQLLTEDYYVANKLMKGYIGSGNIDTNSRLCMASSVAGHRRAFGTDTVPGQYTDLEQADLVVLTGSNLAWCHPVLYQRLLKAKADRPQMRVINIDPRRTATSDIADLHLSIAPGADAALFNRLLIEIDARGAQDAAFLKHVDGYAAALEAARHGPLDTGLTEADLQNFLDLWIGSEKVVTVYSQGINQSSSGADKVNAILNCHLATGRIGRIGMGPFSITGQPNAMGGREVGGLANMLACHLDIENAAHRNAAQGFWASPTMAQGAGLKAVDMFRAVEEGKIKALWIICTNPAVSMPDADRVAAAITACDFVVTSDMIAQTDTTRISDVLLPATGWGEKDGTVTNSERRISRQRAIFPAAGQARDDWRILADVAARMGWGEAFAWKNASEIFAEYAAMSGMAGDMGRDFDISDHARITAKEYDALTPFVWPANSVKTGATKTRFFADGAFHTADGRGKMLPITPRAPLSSLRPDRPFRLNTGRIRDQWHTMTRTGLAPRLTRHIAEPFVEIHPEDAVKTGLQPADLARLTTDHGTAVLRVLISDRAAKGQVFAPMHWTGETAPTGRIDALVAPFTDPVSGQPESKSSVTALERYQANWYGFAVSDALFQPVCEYWARGTLKYGQQAELAGMVAPADWEAYARHMFQLPDAQALTMYDPARGRTRLAFVENGKLRAAIFIAPEPVALARSVLTESLGEDASPTLLAGRAGAGRSDPGAIICACFDVGVNQIIAAIGEGAVSVEAIGIALNAGTNCGSCRPEIKTIIASLHSETQRETVTA